jgi:alanine-glyoxylate transaminase/serine-glyoxylate transaminase/serine-pyruvate transaminase
MIPGPVEAEDSVLEALGQQTIPHYGPQFMALFHDTLEKLQCLFETQGEVIMMPGPGSGALDAALGSLVPGGDGVAVLESGFFGRRLVSMAEAYGLQPHVLTTPWGRHIDPDDVRAFLRQEVGRAAQDGHPLRALALCHHETSTGVLNPLREIAAVAAEFNLAVIVDAVASWGGVRIPVDEWGIDVCVSVPNKCLAAPPGLAVASVSQRAWDMAAHNPSKHGWYLDLRTWRQYIDMWDWHPYPTTMPTNNIAALNQALVNVFDEGVDAFRASFAAAAERARTGLGRLGFTLYPDPAYAAPVVTALNGQPGVDLDAMLRYLREEHGMMLGGGIAELHGRIFRVGHMGLARRIEVVDALIAAVAEYLHEHAPVKG